MKKLLMGLVAVLATSFAIPAFAEDAPAAGGDAKPKKEHKGKKGKKAKDADAKPAEGAK